MAHYSRIICLTSHGGIMMRFFFYMRKRSAFTLIELMIVVAIILFLVKLGIPAYQGYYAKARQTEAALNLSALYTAEQTYQLEHGTFTDNLQAAGWSPKGYSSTAPQNYYTYGFNTPNAQEGKQIFTGNTKAQTSTLGCCSATAEHFIARASAQTNTGLDVWKIDETGTILHETGSSK